MILGTQDLSQRVLVVAEVGNNHEGHFEVAQELIHKAAECGAHAVKFQTYQTECFIHPQETARLKQLKSFELSPKQFAELADLCHAKGLLFFSTPLDLNSADVLTPLVDAFKIASGDITFFPLIAKTALTGKPLILSTGACTFEEVETTVSFVRRCYAEGKLPEQFALLHCVTSYPVPPAQANLKAIPSLADHFRCPIGYSDHTIGIEAAILAVALGARLIEKHFTLDKSRSTFRDHALSADPKDMSELVQAVVRTEAMLGDGRKIVQSAEQPYLAVIRRSIVAGRDLTVGHLLKEGDLLALRLAGGLVPGQESLLLGKRLRRAVRFGEPLVLSDVA
jgi:N,N'-diacetyllegionaminate synthase